MSYCYPVLELQVLITVGCYFGPYKVKYKECQDCISKSDEEVKPGYQRSSYAKCS